MKDKDVRFDPTNAVIVDHTGEIIHNGIHPICPNCGAALLHNRNAVGIWRVGSVTRWECCLCRKQYHTVEIPVPEGMTPEAFYEKIRKALTTEESCRYDKETERSLLAAGYTIKLNGKKITKKEVK